ncbi:MAG: hypothetical protein VB862_09550, partial [Pirellulaceae bacterium]
MFSLEARSAVTSNAQKAATLLQNLPDMEAMKLRSELSQQQQDRLLQAMTTASTFSDEQQMAVLEEFLRIATRDFQATLQATLPDTTSTCPSAATDNHHLEPTASSADLLFEFFHVLPAETMFSLVQRESPQAIAVILSHLPTRQSVAILNRFDPELQSNIVQQIGKLQHVDLQT